MVVESSLEEGASRSREMSSVWERFRQLPIFTALLLRGVVDVLPAAAVVVVRPRQLDSNGDSGTPLGISSGGAIKLNVVSQSIADSHFAIRVEILFSIHSARGTGWIFVFVCFFVCGSGIVWCVTWLEGVTANCTAQEAYLRCV